MRIIKVKDTFIDERGLIADILPSGVRIASILYITGTIGAARGNHHHIKDEHYCYIIEGSISYGWIDENGDKQSVPLEPGDTVYTPAGERHQFIFLTAGAFISMGTEPRDQAHYEEDTIREPF